MQNIPETSQSTKQTPDDTPQASQAAGVKSESVWVLSEIRVAITSALLLSSPTPQSFSRSLHPVAVISVLGSNSRISSDSKRLWTPQQPPARKPVRQAKYIGRHRPIHQPLRASYLLGVHTAVSDYAESSMTIRFRAAEADELVDDERAAQRIYMGSAMTMEPGEFYWATPRFPPPMQ
jgi:hypothetical protein